MSSPTAAAAPSKSLPDLAMELVQLSPSEAHDRILKGLPLQAVLSIVSGLDFNLATTAALLAVQPRTMQRWKSTKKKTLDPVHGSRFYRLMRVFQDGIEIFGTREAILDWLHEEQPALNFRKPIELMTTDAGAASVEQLLTRIRFNVYT